MTTLTLDRLTAQFTALIGPEVLAKARAAIEAAQAAAAKVAAEAAAAKAAAPKPVPTATPAPVAGAAKPATPTPPATPVAPKPVAAATPTAPATNAAPKPAPIAAAPRPVAAPVAPQIPTNPLQATAHALKGYDLDVTVAPDQVSAAATILDFDGFALDAVTGVDWLAQNEMEVVYDYFHPTEPLRVAVRTRVPRSAPEVPTICDVFPGANWHERETHDFFGIRFTGHPNLKPFLLPEDANFHPLRKDYAP